MGRTMPAAVIAALTLGTAAIAGENEIRWRRAIEADISNGAPVEAICRKAMGPAQISDEVAFKNYAYGVVRKYCPEMLNEDGKAYKPPKPKIPAELEALKPEGCEMVINGWRPKTCNGAPNLRIWSRTGGR